MTLRECKSVEDVDGLILSIPAADRMEYLRKEFIQISFNRNFDIFKHIMSYLTNTQLEKLLLFRQRDDHGYKLNNLFHEICGAYGTVEMLKYCLDTVAPEFKHRLLEMSNGRVCGPLYRAFRDSTKEKAHLLLEHIPLEDRDSHITALSDLNSRQTWLMAIGTSSTYWHQTVNLFLGSVSDEHARRKLILHKSDGKYTWLNYCRNIEYIRVIFSYINHDEQIELIKHYISPLFTENFDKFCLLLELLPEADWKDVLLMRDEYNRNCMFYVTQGFLPSSHEMSIEELDDTITTASDYGDNLRDCVVASDIMPHAQKIFSRIVKAVGVENIHELLSGSRDLYNPNRSCNFLKFILLQLKERDRAKVLLRKDPEGNTLLHAFASCGAVSCQVILDFIPTERKSAYVTTVNSESNTALYYARDAETCKLLLDSLPEKASRQQLPTQNAKGYTSLLYHYTHFSYADKLTMVPCEPIKQDVFETLLDRLPQSLRDKVLTLKDCHGNTPVHYCSHMRYWMKSQNVLYRALSKQIKAEVLLIENHQGLSPVSLLDQCSSCVPFIEAIVHEIIVNHHLIECKNDKGRTVLHYLPPVSIIEAIIECTPVKHRRNHILSCDHLGNSPLSIAMNSPNGKGALMLYILEINEKDICKLRDQAGNTLLHKAIRNLQFTEMILDKLSSLEDFNQLCHTKNHKGENFLHCKSDSNALRAVMAVLSEERRKILIAECFSPLKYITHSLDKSKVLLEYLSDSERQDLLSKKDSQGWTWISHELHRGDLKTACYYISLFTNDLVSHQPMINCSLLSVDEENKTFLMQLNDSTDSDSIELLLSLLSFDERRKLLLMSDTHGRTVFHLKRSEHGTPSAMNLQVLELLLSEVKYLNAYEVVTAHDVDGMTCLMNMDVNYVEHILRHIPLGIKVRLLMTMDKKGCSLLHQAVAYNSSYIKLILESVPPEVADKLSLQADDDGDTCLIKFLKYVNIYIHFGSRCPNFPVVIKKLFSYLSRIAIQRLLLHKNHQGETALFHAVDFEDTSIMLNQFELDNLQDYLKATDKDGNTALMCRLSTSKILDGTKIKEFCYKGPSLPDKFYNEIFKEVISRADDSTVAFLLTHKNNEGKDIARMLDELEDAFKPAIPGFMMGIVTCRHLIRKQIKRLNLQLQLSDS